MRPGKPLIAGTLGEAVLLGLPGNPASAFVTATLFLLPLVRHLAGARDPFQPRGQAPLAVRSEEHTSELQSLMRISYAVFCLKKNKTIILSNILICIAITNIESSMLIYY